MGYLSFIDEELSHGIPALLKQLPPSPSQQGGEEAPLPINKPHHINCPSYSIMAVELSESAAEVDELVLEVQQWGTESNEIVPTATSSNAAPPTVYVTSSSDWDAFLSDLKTTSEQLWGTIAALPTSNRRSTTTPSQQQQPLLQRALELLFNGDAGYVVEGGGDGHSAPTVEQWKATVGSLLLLLLNRWCDLVTLLGEVVAILEVGGGGGGRSSSPLTSIHKMDALMLASIGALHTIEPFSHRNAQANRRCTAASDESPCGEEEGYQILRKMCNDGISSSSANFDHTYAPLLTGMKSLFTECANVIASCFVDIGNFWLLSSPSPLVSALSSNRGGGGADGKSSPSTGLVQACHNTVVAASSSTAEGGGGAFGFVSREGALPNLGEVGGNRRSSNEASVGIGAPFVVSGACQAPISVQGMAVSGGVSSSHQGGDLDVEMLLVATGALLSVTHSKAACYRICTFDRTLEAFGVKSLALRRVQSQASQDSFVASPLGGSGGDEDADGKFSKRSERCLMALARLEQSVALLQSAIYGYISTKASIFITTTIMPAIWGGDWEKHQNFLGGRAITHSIPYFYSYLASEILEKQIMMSGCGGGDGANTQSTTPTRIILSDVEKTTRRVLCDITASTYKRTFITHYTNHVLTTRCSFNRTKQLNADTLAVVRYTRWLRQLGVHNRINGPQQQHYLWSPPPRTVATVSKTSVEYFSHCATVDADSSVRDFFLLDLIPTEIHLPSAFSGDGSEAEMWEVQKLMVLLTAIGLRTSDLENLSTWRESQRRQFIDNLQDIQHDGEKPSVIAVNEQGISSDLSKPPTPPLSAFSHQTPAQGGGGAVAEEGGEAPADDVEGFMNVFWTLPSAKSSLQQQRSSSSSACGWNFDLVMDLHHSWATNSTTAKKSNNQPPRILTPLTMKFTSGTAAEVKNWQLLPTGLSVATLSTTDAPGFGTTKIGSFFASSSEALRLGAYFGRACQHNSNALSCFDLLLKEVEMLCTKASPSSPHHHHHHHTSTPSSKHQIPTPLLSPPAIHTLTHLPLVNLLCVADVAGLTHDLLPGTSMRDSQQQQQLDDTVDGNQNTISSILSVSFGVLSGGGGGSTISGQHGGSSSNLTSPRGGGGGASSLDASMWKLVDKVVTLRYEFWDVYPALTEEQLASRNHYLKVSK